MQVCSHIILRTQVSLADYAQESLAKKGSQSIPNLHGVAGLAGCELQCQSYLDVISFVTQGSCSCHCPLLQLSLPPCQCELQLSLPYNPQLKADKVLCCCLWRRQFVSSAWSCLLLESCRVPAVGFMQILEHLHVVCSTMADIMLPWSR